MEWWPERKLSPDFLRSAGRCSTQEISECWKEIPDEWKNTAFLFIHATFALKEQGRELTCLQYRIMMFSAMKDLEKKGIKVNVPYYWFVEGVMIQPEWIVNITNGIVGFSGDKSCKKCGRDDCFFRGYDWKGDKKC